MKSWNGTTLSLSDTKGQPEAAIGSGLVNQNQPGIRRRRISLVLTVQGFAQTSTPAKVPGSPRDELKHMLTETGMSVAMFDHGKHGSDEVSQGAERKSPATRHPGKVRA